MANKKAIPQIRFKGFNDTWEQRKLGEIAEITSGFMGDSLLSDGKYHLTRIETISDGIVDENRVGYSNKKPDDMYLLQCGDILYSNINSISHMGKVAKYQGNMPLYHGINLLRLQPKNDINSDFLLYLLNTEKCRNWAKTRANQAVSQASINQSLLATQEIAISSIDEQKQIGEYFRNLDRLITHRQQKYEKLLNIKKSMLEKMFPQNGSNVPEIRFKEFTDAWEPRKFSELYAKSSAKNDGSMGVDKNITVATMQFKDDVRVSTDDYLKTYYTFNIGDIAFEGHQSKEFRYGRFVENDIGSGIVSHIFSVFRPISEYDLHFWKYAINNEHLMQSILSRSTKASTMMHDLVTDDFLNETFLVPTVEEQRKIGQFLDELDRLITLQQRELEKLQNIKESMLEKMFV